MLKIENVENRKCRKSKMLKIENVENRRCRKSTMQKIENVENRKCEKSKMLKIENVELQRCRHISADKGAEGAPQPRRARLRGAEGGARASFFFFR